MIPGPRPALIKVSWTFNGSCLILLPTNQQTKKWTWVKHNLLCMDNNLKTNVENLILSSSRKWSGPSVKNTSDSSSHGETGWLRRSMGWYCERLEFERNIHVTNIL